MKSLIYFAIHKLAVWVARKTVDPRLDKKLDKVYDRLDYEMPFILRTSSSGSINNLVFGLVAKETGLTDVPLVNSLVDQVFQVYDPRKGVKE